nr:hypothetical protein [Bacteroidota bacterium]
MMAHSAPDVTVRELNNELIVSIENYANKKVEFYSEKDPIIPSFIYFNNQTISFTDEQRTYNFQGYQLFQLRDESVTLADLADIDKARLVAQCDIKDSIAMIVNYKWNDNSKFWDAQIKVQGENKGLKHAFDITKDAFAQGADRLINYKTYYYTLVSYAHNEYYPFFGGLGYPENPTQNKSYLRGRLNVKVYAAVPHNPINENFGTALNSQFAQGIAVQRIEGQGNGNHALDLSEASVNEALTAPDYRSYFPIYIGGHAPITVAVYDPMKLRTNDFETKLTGITDNDGWSMTSSRSNEVIKNEYPIGIQNEQMIVEDGISANIKNSYALLDSVNNDGFIEATLESEGVNNWLTFVKDNDNTVIENWIRSAGKDSLKHLPFTKILDGTVAPFIFVRGSSDSYAPFSNIPAYTVDSQALASVDIVFTSDKSKWTRCPVLEIQGTITQTVPNGIKKMDLRGGASVDKNGVANFGAVDNNDFATGMSWFPGYAINIETGERLNMAFGENSAVNHDMIFNPSDVMYDANKKAILGGFHYVYVFNHVADGPANMPRYDEGKFIHQKLSALNTDMKKQLYRECIWVTLPLLKKGGVLNSCDVKMRLRVAKPFANYDTRKEIFEGTTLKTGTTYTVKVSQIIYNNNIYQPGETFTATQNISFSGSGSVVAGSFLNSAMPMYRFNTNPLQAVTNNDEASKSALDIINVVPNPYYAYSAYEKNQLDNVIKITNVPSRCTISIYTINGTLIRKYKRDVQPDNSKAGLVEENNMNTSVNWDLKNSKAIPVASGMYIIHVDVPGIGVRTLHAMVIMRQVDVDTF